MNQAAILVTKTVTIKRALGWFLLMRTERAFQPKPLISKGTKAQMIRHKSK
jgi:hypothetical protein